MKPIHGQFAHTLLWIAAHETRKPFFIVSIVTVVLVWLAAMVDDHWTSYVTITVVCCPGSQCCVQFGTVVLLQGSGCIGICQIFAEPYLSFPWTFGMNRTLPDLNFSRFGQLLTKTHRTVIRWETKNKHEMRHIARDDVLWRFSLRLRFSGSPDPGLTPEFLLKGDIWNHLQAVRDSSSHFLPTPDLFCWVDFPIFRSRWEWEDTPTALYNGIGKFGCLTVVSYDLTSF